MTEQEVLALLRRLTLEQVRRIEKELKEILQLAAVRQSQR